ncbi:MAG: CBS domain-containing protein [Bacteroidetes bacterium]|nr:CBS domain-containing protein [Bacteroidota bacterium]
MHNTHVFATIVARMIAAQLINKELPVLSPKDKVSKALDLMDEYKVAHLPVVEKNVYLGLVSEKTLLDIDDSSETLKGHVDPSVRPFMFEDQHLFDALKLIDTFKISLVPVLSKDEKYLGSFSEYSLADSITGLTAVQQPGGIIILEMNPKDYTLTQIAKIVEENDARILACYLTPQQGTDRIEVTLKINREDLSAILQTFSRFNYTVKASFHQSEYDEDMRRRFELFMNYVNM